MGCGKVIMGVFASRRRSATCVPIALCGHKSSACAARLWVISADVSASLATTVKVFAQSIHNTLRQSKAAIGFQFIHHWQSRPHRDHRHQTSRVQNLNDLNIHRRADGWDHIAHAVLTRAEGDAKYRFGLSPQQTINWPPHALAI